MDDELVACVVCLCERSILVAQEGLNCATDGFMRLLVRIDLACVSQATGVFAAERSACVIRNGQKLDWLFLRSPDEVDRLLGQLSQLGVIFMTCFYSDVVYAKVGRCGAPFPWLFHNSPARGRETNIS